MTSNTNTITLGLILFGALSTATAPARADIRVQAGAAGSVHIPIAESGGDAVGGIAPKVALSWIAPSGLELGYVYSPLRMGELDAFIDHALFAGYTFERGAIDPYARLAVGLACENHHDVASDQGERDDCSGPVSLRPTLGARLALGETVGVSGEITVGLTGPSLFGARAQGALLLDLRF